MIHLNNSRRLLRQLPRNATSELARHLPEDWTQSFDAAEAKSRRGGFSESPMLVSFGGDQSSAYELPAQFTERRWLL